jgi:hypothetical protein
MYQISETINMSGNLRRKYEILQIAALINITYFMTFALVYREANPYIDPYQL